MQFSFKLSYCLNDSFLCFSFSRYFPPLLRGQRDKNCETFSERYGTKSSRDIPDTYACIPSLCSRSLISAAYSGRLNFHNNCKRAKRSPCHSTRQYPRSLGRFNGLGPLKLARPLADIYSNIYFTHFPRSSTLLLSSLLFCSLPPSIFCIGEWLWD